MTSAPSLYEVEIAHTRTSPIRHAFTYGGYQWLVDLDDLPTPRVTASFRSGDHVGDPHRPIRENLDTLLATHGIDLCGGRILMLTQARVFGYVFNPLSVFWCYYPTDELACVVAEVHNTYGGRHAYILHTDKHGSARAAKEFYVSPFHPVDGEYSMQLPVPGERLAVSITLHRPGSTPFVATMRGRKVLATRRELVRMIARHPMAPLMGAFRIRRHGIALWLRGLRPVGRPSHHSNGVS